MTTPQELAARLQLVDWNPTDSQAHLRVALMRESLRRSALWARQLQQSSAWPFFDIAAAVDPDVQVDPVALELVRGAVAGQHPTVRRSCEWMLSFAALADRPVPALPDPYAPLLSLYEHGGGFTLDGTGMIDVGPDASLARGRCEHWLDAQPVPLPAELAESPLRGGPVAGRYLSRQTGHAHLASGHLAFTHDRADRE